MVQYSQSVLVGDNLKNEKAIILNKTKEYVKETLINDSSGHDWWHIQRVRNTALYIGETEDVDLFIVEMAALLHDIADEKLNLNEEMGRQKVMNWLKSLDLSTHSCESIMEIIATLSFKGGNRPPMKTLEGQVVQDADRLDAIGAIGIARTFAYAGFHGDLIYDPEISVRETMSKEEYRNEKSTAINHIYEKLLKLKDALNTNTARKLAEERHQFMVTFLDQFYREWNGQ